MTEYSLDPLGLAKPATMLIEKISNALGRHFDPSQTVRMAEAEAEAVRILALSRVKTDIEARGLRQRAAERFINEEMTKQMNIDRIVGKAIPRLTDDASPVDMEEDWITNFFDKSRIVSDEDMQILWAGILAGEANNPGSFSRRTVNLMADLDKRDAELFRNLCSFVWVSGERLPLVFDHKHEIYNQHGINSISIGHLESLGLVRTSALTGFVSNDQTKASTLSYNGREVTLTFRKNQGNQLQLGKVLLTQSGQELARICDAPPVNGFFEYIYDHWASQSLVPPREAQQGE